MHDNENAAFSVALDAIKNGGRLVVVENGDRRFLHGSRKDPNRIFAKNNSHKILADEILRLLNFQKKEPIIALHNNKKNGNFNFENVKNLYPHVKKFPGKNSAENLNDKNSLLWISGTQKYEKLPADEKQKILDFQNLGMNVVYENVRAGKNDGSLSRRAARENIIYYNIESADDAAGAARQKKYLENILNYQKTVAT